MGGAVGGKDQAQQELDGGAFARAVGAQQAKDFAALDGEVEVVEGADLVAAPEIFVDLGEMLGMYGRGGGWIHGDFNLLGETQVAARARGPHGRQPMKSRYL